ncbi:MAG TPA: clostripain-related cysteine peptidase [Symbiobacteriaceae bacterium]|nr:clostripain-related cysteine peptidase [Symbiobacteriaceae bacterium]
MTSWLVMLYLAGADDLEPFMTRALLALELAGAPAGIEVVAQLARAPRAAVAPILPERPPTEIDGDWHGTRRYRLRRRPAGEPPDHLASELLADLGPVSPADPAVLADFVADATDRFPAERSLLLISGHGMGFVGITLDLTGGGAPVTMSIRSLATALRRLRRRPDILLLDACQMNSLDVLCQFALPTPAAVALIAPASHAPRAGLDYRELLQTLAKVAATATQEAAAAVAGALEPAARLQVLAFRLDADLWRAVAAAARAADSPMYLPMYARASEASLHPGPGQRLRLLVTWPNPVDFPERYRYLYRRLQFTRRAGWERLLDQASWRSAAREELKPLPVPTPLVRAWLQILRPDLSASHAEALLVHLKSTDP